MKILISAAETSSDAHAAKLLEALRAQLPLGEKLEAFGVGGPHLQAAGLRTVVDARELLSMGFFEIFNRLPRIFEALKQLSDEAAREKPDLAVVVDYPDFHFRLAKRLKAQGVPVIYYIPPKVWAWRKSRVHLMRKLFASVLAILPFEEAFYRDHGMKVKYVGNPLLDELPLSGTKEQARQRLGIGAEEKVLCMLVGSRPSELRHHMDLMLESATRAAAQLRSIGKLKPTERLSVLLPFPATADLEALRRNVDSWLSKMGGMNENFILNVKVSQSDAPWAMLAADVGLIKSGTSTLEAGILGCPHAVVYKPNWATQVIFKCLIRYRGPVGLVNLVYHSEAWRKRPPFLIREIVLDEATERNLSDEIVSLFVDTEKRARISAGLADLKSRMLQHRESPSQVAAAEILRVVSNR